MLSERLNVMSMQNALGVRETSQKPQNKSENIYSCVVITVL